MTSPFGSLSTDRLILRLLNDKDLHIFQMYRNDPDVARYQSWTSFSMVQAQELLSRQQGIGFAEPGTWVQLACCDKVNDTLLGDFAVHFLDDEHDDEGSAVAGQVEIGFTFAAENQGKGYAIEGLIALLKYLFVDLCKHRVTATVDALNEKAVYLLGKLNFRREAHFVENIWFKGKWGSEMYFALLRREFLSAVF